MDTQDEEFCGFLDVKTTGRRYIIQKVRKKALMSSKVWKRLWCSAKRSKLESGVRVQLNAKHGYNKGTLIQSEETNSILIPSNAIVLRIPSKTKPFAFCVSLVNQRVPLLTLSANSETETQRWMSNIRHLLKPRRHCCMEKSYDVSVIDNAHSKAAGLTGLYGDLIATEAGVLIKNVHTGLTVEAFDWTEFSQFHLTTVGRPEDVKRICVIHTTKEFRCGSGELYIFCLDAGKLLQDLVTQGRGPKHRLRSLSRNNDNLEESLERNKVTRLASQQRINYTCTDDSMVDRVAQPDENIYELESNQIYKDEQDEENLYIHGESDISVASGIYEKITDDICSPESKAMTTAQDTDKILHRLQAEPPPLPPRPGQMLGHPENIRVSAKQHFHTELSDVKKRLLNTEICTQENIPVDNSNYVPMSPLLDSLNTLKLDIVENEMEYDYIYMH